MPKTPLPKYGNQQIKEIIMEYIHDKRDRKILYLYLVDGETIESISNMLRIDRKTVWTHLRDGKQEVFSHFPGE